MGLFSQRWDVIGSDDPRAYRAGYYRKPDGSPGAEIRVPDTRMKVLIGSPSAGKGRGVILPNALKRTGVSQVFVDTRCQSAAVSAPWRRTVDRTVKVSNAFGALGHLPAYADLQGNAGINLLEAPELDPDDPRATGHLTVMARTLFPEENNKHQPFFPIATQGIFIAFAYGELVQAKREKRKPLMANIRLKVLERSEYDRKTGAPVAGMAFYAQQIYELGNPLVRSCIGRFCGTPTDETRAVIGTFEAGSRFMVEPALMADEQRGGMDFAALGQSVSSLYLAVPAESVDACRGWLKLAITGAIRPLFPPHPQVVSFWLDEFFALKRLPIVDQIGVLAGSKIEVIVVVQSLTMLRELYGDAWEAFLGTASVITLIGSPGDYFTCDWLVKRSGEKTISPQTGGWQLNPNGGGWSGGWALQTRPTLSHNELFALQPGEGFLWLHGLDDPVPAIFPGYYQKHHPDYRMLSRRARRDPYVRW